MIRRAIFFKDVEDEFLKKYPQGMLVANGTKFLVAFSEQGTIYEYARTNHLDLAHRLGILLNVGYLSEYNALLHDVKRLYKQLYHFSDEQRSGFGKQSKETIEQDFARAQAAFAEFKEKYTEAA